ncbi:MAG: HAD superfamily hydrolase (TIGR01509 family) [Cognaticolwellia sp.]|jgi:HAD superfamily hydrolase (TIGR01509 family)
MIQAVIFDMDGLLINSEPFWKAVEIDVFGTVGIELTEEMCLDTVGLRIDEVVEYWYEKHPWKTPSTKKIEHQIVNKMIERITNEGEALPGVYDILEFFWNKKIPMAIASSSYLRIIEAVVKRLKLKGLFDTIYSAEFEKYGKPNPGTFLTTAEKLGVAPTKCLVFEDSLNGVIAGKAARMITIAVPEYDNPKFIIADKILNSLEEWNAEMFEAFS